jgi:uncharacterized membrane protein
MVELDRGTLIREYPATFAFKNWPFFVFLLFLASVLAYAAYVAGNLLAAAFLFGAVWLVPIVVFVLFKAVELRVPTVRALHENGVVVTWQWSTQFVPWSEVIEARSWVRRSEGLDLVESDHRFVRLTSRTVPRIDFGPLQGGLEIQRFVEARLPVKTVDEGRRSGW